MRINFLMLIFTTLCTTSLMATLDRAKDRLAASLTHFDKGQYQQALKQLQEVHVQKDFDSSDDMKLALKIRAIAYDEIGDVVQAKEAIRELLFLDPAYKFDAFDTPARVVSLADQERVAIEYKNKQLATVKGKIEQNVQKITPPKKSDFYVVEKPKIITTLFPLGLNHYYLSSPIKGGIYLSTQVLGLAANIGAFWWKQSYLKKFGSSDLKHLSYENRFHTAQTIQYIGLGAMITGYAVSVIDALIRFQFMPAQKLPKDEITS